MRLSKERRTYLAILGLGAAAVGVDRLWLGSGPTSVSAALPVEIAAAGITATPGIAAGKPSAVVSVSRRLESIASSEDIGRVDDAFTLPDAWTTPPQTAVEAAAEGVIAARRALPRVTGIVGRGASVAAVIDGEIVVLGETSSAGVTLVAVEGHDVTVEIAGERVTISRDVLAPGR